MKREVSVGGIKRRRAKHMLPDIVLYIAVAGQIRAWKAPDCPQGRNIFPIFVMTLRIKENYAGKTFKRNGEVARRSHDWEWMANLGEDLGSIPS